MDRQEVAIGFRRRLTQKDVDDILLKIEDGCDIDFQILKHLDLKENGYKTLFTLLEKNGYEMKNGDWVKTKRKVDRN